MTGIVRANLVLRFVLECALVVVAAWFGWWVGGSLFARIALAVILPLTVALLWGRYAAPRRPVATPPWVPVLMYLGFGALAVAALAVMGRAPAAVALAVLVASNEAVRLLGPRLVGEPEARR